MRTISIILFLIILMFGIVDVLAFYHGGVGGGDSVETADIDFMVEPANPVAGETITATFLAVDSGGNVIRHIDYRVRVSLGGELKFEREFHDHEGDLKVIFVPGDGSISVSGSPEEGGVYTVNGPVFTVEGTYSIEVSIVGIEFSPITPITKTYTLGVGMAQSTPADNGPASGVEEPSVEEPGPAGGGTNNILVVFGALGIVVVITSIYLFRRGR